ncbi:MAG: hypothetical protein EBR13_07140, partial [Rhodobacteraceae bacterium]|nr:hypothetical protein [Paracoccaceae bacterium]
NATSRLGAELDSLSDFLCFGVAPALLVYHMILDGTGSLGWIAVLTFAGASCLRLARFNVMRAEPDKIEDSTPDLDDVIEEVENSKPHFVGVPAPGGAMLGLLPLYLIFAGWDFPIMHPFAAALWLALNYWRGTTKSGGFGKQSVIAAIIVVAVLMQSLLGALVAGINAGKTYTDWPLMDGDFIPDGLFDMQPFWLNFFESHLTVQFDHRMVAYALTAFIVWHIHRVLRSGTGGAAALSAKWLGGALLLQIVLGISALMLAVPISLGAAHQLGAVALLAIAVTHLHILYKQAL